MSLNPSKSTSLYRVRIPSYSCSDWSGNSHVRAPISHCQPHVRLIHFLSSCLTASIHRLSTPTHRLLLNHHRKTLANESRFFPPSQPSAFPFYLLSPSFSFAPLGNDDQHLAAAARH